MIQALEDMRFWELVVNEACEVGQVIMGSELDEL